MSAPGVPVYFANKTSRTRADYMDWEGARQMVEAGLATWVKKATAIELKRSSPAIHRPDQSLTMGAKVSEGAANHQPRYTVLVASWQPGARVSRVLPGDWMKAAA